MLCFVLLFAVAFATRYTKYEGDVTVDYSSGTYTEVTHHEGECIKVYGATRTTSYKANKKEKNWKNGCAECKSKYYFYETKYYDNDNCKDDPVNIVLSDNVVEGGEDQPFTYKWKTPKHVAILIPCADNACAHKDDTFKYRDTDVTFYMEGKWEDDDVIYEWVVENNGLYKYKYDENGNKEKVGGNNAVATYECGTHTVENVGGYYLECGAMSVFVSVIAMIALFLF